MNLYYRLEKSDGKRFLGFFEFLIVENNIILKASLKHGKFKEILNLKNYNHAVKILTYE